MIHYSKYKKRIPKTEFLERMKRLKATKKAANELNEADKLFYEFLISIGLTKEQSSKLKGLNNDLDVITEQYQQ